MIERLTNLILGKKRDKKIFACPDFAVAADNELVPLARYLPMDICDYLNNSPDIAANYYHLESPGQTQDVVADTLFPETIVDNLAYSSGSQYVIYGCFNKEDSFFSIFIYSAAHKKNIFSKNLKKDKFLVELRRTIDTFLEEQEMQAVKIPGNLFTENLNSIMLLAPALTSDISVTEKCVALEKSLELDPSFGKAVIALSKISDSPEKSGHMLEGWLNKYACPLVNLEYAGILFFLKQYKCAQKQLEYLLLYEPENVQALYLKACILRESETGADVQGLLEKCVSIKPGFYNAVLDLSALYIASENYDAAVNLYTKYSGIHKNAELMSNTASAYYNMQNFKKAFSLYHEAYKMHPDKQIAWNLHLAAKELGYIEDAEKYRDLAQ